MFTFSSKKNIKPNTPLELAIKDFIESPSQSTYNKYLNEFAATMDRGDVVYVPIFAEDNLPDGTPSVSFARIFIDKDEYLYFFTSKKYTATSKHPNFAEFPLLDFVNLVKGFDDKKGVLINPSDGKDVWLPMDLLNNLYQAVIDHRNNNS